MRAVGLALLAFGATQPDRLRQLVLDAQLVLRPWDLGAAIAALRANAGLQSSRLLKCCALIVDVPPALLGFAHAPALRYIDRAGQVRPVATARFVAADPSRARAQYPCQPAFHAAAAATRERADDAPANDLRAFYR